MLHHIYSVRSLSVCRSNTETAEPVSSASRAVWYSGSLIRLSVSRKAQAQPNVNWIQVTGIDGARNQIVQPGTTAWMMDNNAPYFYVKSVDGVGSVTFKAFEFHEVQANNPQPVVENMDAKYVTREEFNKLLDTLKPQPEEQKGELTHE